MGKVKLSDKDLRVLAAAQLGADQSAAEIATRCKESPSTVRYTLKKLQDNGAIAPYALIDFFRLGYQLNSFFFSLSPAVSVESHTIAQWLQDRPGVSWVYENIDEQGVAFGLLLKHPSELQSLLEELVANFGLLFTEKHCCIVKSMHVYGRKYFSRSIKQTTIHLEDSFEEAYEPKPEEEEILSALSTNGTSSLRQTAKDLGVSFSTFEYRLKKLRSEGVVKGVHYSIRPAKFGVQLYRVYFKTTGANAEKANMLRFICEAKEEIVSLMEMIGSIDFALRVEVWDSRDVHSLLEELKKEFPDWISEVIVTSAEEQSKFVFYPFGSSND